MEEAKQGDRVEFEGSATYQIVIRGFLDEKLSDRLGGMRITSEGRGKQKPVTTLVGRDRALGVQNSFPRSSRYRSGSSAEPSPNSWRPGFSQR